ncbi:hypothetical protein RI054_41g148640 [Pseudoscourfieldia marina]
MMTHWSRARPWWDAGDGERGTRLVLLLLLLLIHRHETTRTYASEGGMSDFKYVTGWSMFRSTLPKNAKEVENELIRHASDARPLPAGHAWRVVEVRSNTGLHTSYVGRSSKSNPPAVEGVAVWCCSYHADDEGCPRKPEDADSQHLCVELLGQSHWYPFEHDLRAGQFLCANHSLHSKKLNTKLVCWMHRRVVNNSLDVAKQRVRFTLAQTWARRHFATTHSTCVADGKICDAKFQAWLLASLIIERIDPNYVAAPSALARGEGAEDDDDGRRGGGGG